jgi:heat shock protein 90kDa beta
MPPCALYDNADKLTREIFLRELISNANDAIEKLRLISLTDKSVWDGSEPLNITVKAIKNEDRKGGRLIISGMFYQTCLLQLFKRLSRHRYWYVPGRVDQELGMIIITAEVLFAHTLSQGTLAKSGTSEFLARADSEEGGAANGNLIGAFGLGFYSSFLVADRVHVASITPASPKNPKPVQHVFSSSSDDSSFEIFQDPRGNTIGRHGTEITLYLKEDALEYLENPELITLVYAFYVAASRLTLN